MSLVYRYLIPAMWLAFFAYWWAISTKVKVTVRRESMASRVLRPVVIVGAMVLLGLPRLPLGLLGRRFLPPGVWWFWIGAAVTAAGLLFAVWARRRLGRNWSQAVTVKQDHELITSGPYAIVRHPIYSGHLLAFVGWAVACGQWRGLLAVALVLAVFWHKLRLEEKWMHAQFGEPYEAYSRRVPALLPYVI